MTFNFIEEGARVMLCSNYSKARTRRKYIPYGSETQRVFVGSFKPSQAKGSSVSIVLQWNNKR